MAFIAGLLTTFLPPVSQPVAAVVEEPGFRVTTVFSGLNQPTALAFAADGRVFVIERGGVIKAFDGLTDTTATTVVNLSAQVHSVGDRGMLGLAVDPGFATGRPYIYVTYTVDAPPGGTAPFYDDRCTRDPATGANDACPATGRLSRIQVGADSRIVGAEQVLIGGNYWCHQAQAHAIDHVEFGPDGALYVSSGDGAGALVTDYGQQTGSTANACGDPPKPVGETLSLPTSEGGSLRSQDLRTSADPAGGSGAIVRVHPDTGAAMAGNPLIGNGVPTDDRHIAYGLRNPFRFTFRPATAEIWIGDVGWNTWEEINRILNPADATVENFGWPCYEGTGRQPQWDNLNVNMCEQLYAQAGAVTPPHWTYRLNQSPDAENCGTSGGAVSGVAFSEGAPFPSAYNGALFVADYVKRCIWALRAGTNGLPDPTRLDTILSDVTPVDLEIGPDGRLYYADIATGTVHRIDYFGGNQPPTARVTATPDSGPLPLAVDFDASATTDDGPISELEYEWDLDGDGAFDDATGVTTSHTYEAAATVDVGVRATDAAGDSDTATVTVHAGNSRPTATIVTPSPTDTWASGDDIPFSGSGSDPEDGALGGAAMQWTVTLQHCHTPTDCHAHPQVDISGVASDSFLAPEHSFPSYLEFRLTVTDSGGLTDVETVRVDPRTVDLTFQTSPSGLELLAGELQGPAPLTVTAIVGSHISVSAPSPQTVSGVTYDFSSWSDGGAASHDVLAGSTDATYTASYEARPAPPAALLVVGNGGSPILADTAVRNRLQSLGFTVTIVDDSASTTAHASGKGLVIIAASVVPSAVNTKFSAVAVPVITWEQALYDDLGLTASPGASVASQRSITITNSGHPLAAGLSGTPTVATTSTYFGWGTPNSNATVVANLVGGTPRPTIFAYDAGAAMPGRTAPARRLATFMGDHTAKSFTTAGWQLFDAAVDWAVGEPPPPPPADTTPPTVTGRSPAPDEMDVATSANVTATFSEPMNASTISGTTFTLSSSGGAVSAAVTYNATTRVATLDPASALSFDTLYTATLDGGAGGMSDSAGNSLAADVVWSFTTAAAPPPPPPPSGGWTHVDTGALVAATGTSVSVPMPTGTQAGDLILLGCQGRNNSMNWSATGYTTLLAPAGPAGLRFELLYKWATASETASLAVTNVTGLNGWSCSLTSFRGGPGSGAPLAAAITTQTGASKTMTAPALASLPDGALVTRWFASMDDNNHGAPSEGALGFGGTAYHTVTGVDHASSMSFVTHSPAGSRGTATMLQNANSADGFIGVSVALVP